MFALSVRSLMILQGNKENYNSEFRIPNSALKKAPRKGAFFHIQPSWR